jgi:hypothetical protein
MFIPMSKNSYFFEMDYDFDDQSVSNLKFEVDHLKINLCLPYVLKLYQMAMEAITRSTDVANITSSSEVSDVTSFVNKRKPEAADATPLRVSLSCARLAGITERGKLCQSPQVFRLP